MCWPLSPLRLKWTVNMTFKISPAWWHWPRLTPHPSRSSTPSTTCASRRLATITKLTCEVLSCSVTREFFFGFFLFMVTFPTLKRLEQTGERRFLETGKPTPAHRCLSRWPCQTSKISHAVKWILRCLAQYSWPLVTSLSQVQNVGGLLRWHLWRFGYLRSGGFTWKGWQGLHHWGKTGLLIVRRSSRWGQSWTVWFICRWMTVRCPWLGTSRMRIAYRLLSWLFPRWTRPFHTPQALPQPVQWQDNQHRCPK